MGVAEKYRIGPGFDTPLLKSVQPPLYIITIPMRQQQPFPFTFPEQFPWRIRDGVAVARNADDGDVQDP